jgi:hypothetical protein
MFQALIDEQLEQLFDGLRAWSIQAAIASQSGFPVLSTRGRFGHQWLDAGRAKRLDDFLHLAGPAFTVLEHPSHHVIGNRSPVHTGVGLGERVVHAIRGTVLAGGKRALQQQRLQTFDDDAAAHLGGSGGASGAVHDLETHAIW